MSSLRDFSQAKRIVIKVGTNVLSKNSGIDIDFLRIIAEQIAGLVRQKRQVILVTSGAIGMGANCLGFTRKITEVKLRQACAAVGQGILMHQYQEAFGQYGQKVAQVLLTNRIMSHRKSYVNLKNAMETLLSMGIVPIVNENDCVSVEEIGLAFGDNDKLSALVASKIDAELLVILTDVAGLYDKNPQQHTDARLITVVYEITDEIAGMAGQAGSKFATGGMASKIAAIRIAAKGGCKVILAHGREKEVISRLLAGDEVGTLFLPKRKISNRKRWILNSFTDARIDIDPGAVTALLNHKSLLLVGITEVTGTFRAGDVVHIGTIAKGVCNVSSGQLRAMLEEKTKNHAAAHKQKAVVHVNDIVLLEP